MESIGSTLEADTMCNECGDSLSVDLVEGANRVQRNKNVGPVRPDLSIFDSTNRPIRFIEIVDSHKPQSNVHEYAAMSIWATPMIRPNLPPMPSHSGGPTRRAPAFRTRTSS